jgi:1A family penicillin-binding protein
MDRAARLLTSLRRAAGTAWSDTLVVVDRISTAAQTNARLQHARQRLAQFGQQHATPRNIWITAAAVALLNLGLYANCGLRGCPDPNRLTAYQPGGATTLLDRNGRKYADLAPVEREVVKLAALPNHVPRAFVAVEDKRFFQHGGVDWKRVLGAALHNVKSRAVEEGSSTITMQLSRNIFSDRLRADDKTLRRKIFEARVAKRIERRFSKQEILELYLNHIYFGGGAYGIQAASRHYFGKPAARLDLDEAALLAALPKAPSNYNPRQHGERAKQRRNLVLDRMAQQGLIEVRDAERAKKGRLGVTREAPGFNDRPPLGAYFVQVVRDQLEELLGERLYRDKLRVHTTLDANAQRVAEHELQRQLRALEAGQFGSLSGPRYSNYREWTAEGPQYLQGAAIIMESMTGDVLALVGGRDFRHSRFNRATMARRQSGSAFKPFVFGAALEEGYVPSQPILDAPFRLVSDGTTWEPRNYDNRFYGPISMREALVYSRNIPSVRLAAAAGVEEVARFARDAGITSEIRKSPMIALGITEVTPLELARAYGSFAGMGTRAEPRFVNRVLDENGNVIWESEIQRESAIKPAVAFVVTDMLADAVDYGTGNGVREAGYRGPVAGKTGTTSDGADTWFVGYTPDLVAAVWFGYDQRRALPAHASGGSVAAPAWGRMMRGVYRARPMPNVWIIPEAVIERDVDPASGLVLAEGCRPKQGEPRKEVFLTDDEPDTICPAGNADGENILDQVFGAIAGLFGGSDDESVKADDRAVSDVDQNLGATRVARRNPEQVREGRDDDDDDREKKKGKKRKGGKDRD